jgi:nucleoside-diphosphate-sugar epimerase
LEAPRAEGRLRVVAAGASGFVGRAPLPRLAERFDVVALSRGTPPASPYARIRRQRCDLFSLREACAAPLADVTDVLERAVAEPRLAGAVLEVGGPDALSYREMMQRMAALLGRRARTWSALGLSRLWVSLVTQTPRALLAPLIQSLRHPMVASRDDLGALLGRAGIGFEASVARALADVLAVAFVSHVPSGTESPAPNRAASRLARQSDLLGTHDLDGLGTWLINKLDISLPSSNI